MMENQKGRSMIEMLGVLAIVGILSVGGIAGYSKAMTKYKINQETEEFALFMEELIPLFKGIKRMHQNNTSKEYIDVTPALETFLPTKWSRNKNNIYDSLGNNMQIFIRNDQDGFNRKYLSIDYVIIHGTPQSRRELCVALYNNLAKPYADILRKAAVYTADEEGSKALMAWGNNYCKKGVTCLRDITPTEMINNCDSCTEEKTTCSFVIMFTL